VRGVELKGYPIRILLAFYADLLHVNNDMLRRVEDVLVHHRAELCKLSVGETILVDNLHLFHDGALP
jgi:hypothetical protein